MLRGFFEIFRETIFKLEKIFYEFLDRYLSDLRDICGKTLSLVNSIMHWRAWAQVSALSSYNELNDCCSRNPLNTTLEIKLPDYLATPSKLIKKRFEILRPDNRQ